MKFKIDHDYHIHSYLSSCSADEMQSAENILRYAEVNSFKEICVTDHFWDSEVSGASDWYKPQDFDHISAILPLPQGARTKFYFGCEAEMDKYMRVGISDKRIECFDLIIIPTTHLHMEGFTIDAKDNELSRRADVWIERLAGVFKQDLPFKKVGIAHLTCDCIALPDFEDHIKVIEMIGDKTYEELFAKASALGVGIELNMNARRYTKEQFEQIMRPYQIAQRMKCKFYMGSDSHHPKSFENMKENFAMMADYLELTEDDKFLPFR